MFSRLTSSSALTVYIPPAIYTAGSTIDGEVGIDFRALQEENIEEVHIRLRGLSRTHITYNNVTQIEDIIVVRDDVSIWSRGGAFPMPGEHVLRVPFSLTLPEQLPPSFHIKFVDKGATIRYSLTAVGMRKGILNFNKKHRVPLAILPIDELGAQLKADGATHGWKTVSTEEKIRKGLWGAYSKVQVELALPDIPVLPLFSDIPYTISVTTTSPPLTRAKANAHPPDKPVFPPAPTSAHDIEFRLHHKVYVRAQSFEGRAYTPGAVATFLGGKEEKRSKAPVEVDVPEKEWVPMHTELLSADTKISGSGEDGVQGVWVQRSKFRSTLRLNCSPTFAVHNIECSYRFIVQVPFPGIGNDVKLEVPVTIVSGINKPLPREQGNDGASILDLPPPYWDTEEQGWGDDEKH